MAVAGGLHSIDIFTEDVGRAEARIAMPSGGFDQRGEDYPTLFDRISYVAIPWRPHLDSTTFDIPSTMHRQRHLDI